MHQLPFALAAWLFLVGLYGIVTSDNFVHMISMMCRWGPEPWIRWSRRSP